MTVNSPIDKQMVRANTISFQETIIIIQEIVAKKLSTLRSNDGDSSNEISNFTSEDEERNISLTLTENENATIDSGASLSFSYDIERSINQRRPRPAKTQEVSLETDENNVADLKGLTKMQTT